jgi:hypothetical protein
MQSYSDVEASFRHDETTGSPFSLGSGLITWLVSVLLIVGTQIILGVAYVAMLSMRLGRLPKPEELMNLEFALLAIGSTFVAHVLTVLFCWLLITKRFRLPFLPTMGWRWHPQFQWWHAVALGGLMIGMGILFTQLLPHHETEMEKMLKLGASVRWLVVILAIFSAPFVEEFVYRGILYPAVEAKLGWMAGIAVTSFLFALVHVPQYLSSPAALTTIMVLSFVLTAVRAYTGALLPTVVTHFVYNGIQSVMLLLGLTEDSTKQEAIILGGRWWGLW